MDVFGKTSLWRAARSGHTYTMKFLIQVGANPDAHDKARSLELLQEAASNDHTDALRALLKAGIGYLTPKGREDSSRRYSNAPVIQGHTPLTARFPFAYFFHMKLLNGITRATMDHWRRYRYSSIWLTPCPWYYI